MIELMKNTTITLDKKILEDARRHSAKLGISFSKWVGKLIEDAIRRSPKKTMEDLLALSDDCAGNSNGKRWTRDEIYER